MGLMEAGVEGGTTSLSRGEGGHSWCSALSRSSPITLDRSAAAAKRLLLVRSVWVVACEESGGVDFSKSFWSAESCDSTVIRSSDQGTSSGTHYAHNSSGCSGEHTQFASRQDVFHQGSWTIYRREAMRETTPIFERFEVIFQVDQTRVVSCRRNSEKDDRVSLRHLRPVVLSLSLTHQLLQCRSCPPAGVS